MDRDLHGECLRVLRRRADLSSGEVAVLNRVAGQIACGELADDRDLAKAIIWSFHSQGPGRGARLA